MRSLLFLCLTIVLAQAQTIPQNVKVSVYGTYHPEIAIAVNPADPLNLMVASNGKQVYYSYDGGLSWNQHYQGSVYGSFSDPSVIFDYRGLGYLTMLVYNADSNIVLDRIALQRTEDGGKTFNFTGYAGKDTSTFQDKEWLATDLTSSPYKGNLYLSWTRFDELPQTEEVTKDDSSRIFFSYSSDSGTTWSPAMRISDFAGDCSDEDSTMEGAVPAVGPEGQIYISWAGLDKIWFDKSLDGGKTFGKDKIIAEQPGGWDFSIPGLWRCNGLPQTLCDTSQSSQFYGTIYVVFSDQRNGEDNTDVFLIKSNDQGENWSAAIKVNQDTGRAQQFLPWATIDPSSGYLYVVYYDRRGRQGDTTDVYLSRSVDGGETFTDFRINREPFVADSDYFLGDYIGITSYDGHIYPVWVKQNRSETSIWTALINEPVGIENQSRFLPAAFTLRQNHPNPFNATTEISFDLKRTANVTLEVFDLNGRKISTLLNGKQKAGTHWVRFDGNRLASGVYFYRLKTEGGIAQTKKMILLR